MHFYDEASEPSAGRDRPSKRIIEKVSVPGGELHCELTGHGETVALIHGLGLDRRMWDFQVSELSQEFRVLRYDLRGFGLSSLPEDLNYTHHNDLRIALEQLDLGPAHVVGLSMGGAVALDFAGSFPELTRSLTTVSTAVRGYREYLKGMKEIYGEIASALNETENVETAKRIYAESDLFAHVPAGPGLDLMKLILSEYSGWQFSQRFWEPSSKAYPIPCAASERTRFEDIQAQALVLAGRKDLSDFQELADLIVDELPDSQQVIFESAGHMIPIEAPRAFNDMLMNFLMEISTGQCPDT